MTRLLCLAATLLLPPVASAQTRPPPRPDVSPQYAPAWFVSPQYGVAIATPPGATYCPLPKDFTGSDHGTSVFFTPPKRCAGDAGYPSSARGFAPEGTPRIDIFYGYALDEDEGPPKCAHPAGTIRLLGGMRRLCREHGGKRPVYSVTANYTSESASTLSLTLVTTPARAARDLARFRSAAASVRVCSSLWHGEDMAGHRTGPDERMGRGPLCPKSGSFF